jgi:oligopeptidase A
MQTDLLSLPKAKFPDFSCVKAEDINPVINTLLKQHAELLESLLEMNEIPTWDNFIAPLDELEDYFEQIWSAVSHMHAVMCEDDLRLAYEEALGTVSEYFTKVSQNSDVFAKVTKIHESKDFNSYSVAQQKIIENQVRDFKLAGVHLEGDKKQKLLELKQLLSQLTTKFEQNIMDATDSFVYSITNEEDLAGIPDMFIDAAKQKAIQSGSSDRWNFGLDAPTFITILSYAKNRDLREIMYRAYVSRASDVGTNSGNFDNSQIMVDILKVKQQIAQLLGFNNYAEYSLETKMAKNIAEVMSFLQNLGEHSKNQAMHEYSELKEFALAHDNVALMPWDSAYYSEIMRKQRYKYSSNDYREYFPFHQVMSGLFTVVKNVFGLSIEEVQNAPVWHPDVKLYEVCDSKGDLRGYFYIDLYARAKKRGGAWMDDCRTRRVTKSGDLQYPIAFLNCNFSPSVGDKPALLSHDDVVTVFHEFGHTLHHILTKVDYSGVSGISGVMWDAVELPSQFLEHWSYSKEGLEMLARHYETGEKMPFDMLNGLLEAKNFHSAMQMVRQLEFAVFDIEIYSNLNINDSSDIQNCLDNVRSKYAVVPFIPENRFQHSFSHIFAGGYAAGYYSYKWAEVLSSDAYTVFEDNGVFHLDSGQKFMSCILEQGGTFDADILFEKFLGRSPDVSALLRHSGIGENNA